VRDDGEFLSEPPFTIRFSLELQIHIVNGLNGITFVELDGLESGGQGRPTEQTEDQE